MLMLHSRRCYGGNVKATYLFEVILLLLSASKQVCSHKSAQAKLLPRQELVCFFILLLIVSLFTDTFCFPFDIVAFSIPFLPDFQDIILFAVLP